jgi:hypothetical protein
VRRILFEDPPATRRRVHYFAPGRLAGLPRQTACGRPLTVGLSDTADRAAVTCRACRRKLG